MVVESEFTSVLAADEIDPEFKKTISSGEVIEFSKRTTGSPVTIYKLVKSAEEAEKVCTELFV